MGKGGGGCYTMQHTVHNQPINAVHAHDTTVGWMYCIPPEYHVTAQLVYGTVVTVNVSPVLALLGFEFSLVCFELSVGGCYARTDYIAASRRDALR